MNFKIQLQYEITKKYINIQKSKKKYICNPFLINSHGLETTSFFRGDSFECKL